MVEQPAGLISSPASRRPASCSPAGLNQGNVEVRVQLMEPANQAATGESSSDDGEINISHGC